MVGYLLHSSWPGTARSGFWLSMLLKITPGTDLDTTLLNRDLPLNFTKSTRRPKSRFATEARAEAARLRFPSPGATASNESASSPPPSTRWAKDSGSRWPAFRCFWVAGPWSTVSRDPGICSPVGPTFFVPEAWGDKKIESENPELQSVKRL